MDGENKVIGVVGMVDDPDTLLAAAAAVRDAGYRKWDCHTPYPVHGLDDAMGLKPSPVPAICLGAGFLGVAAALAMQGWMSAVDYPVKIGGKPLFSWPAFIPITFELFVLFAALATMASIIGLGRLGRWRHPLHEAGLMEQVTANRFAVLIDAADPAFASPAAQELLHRAGCSEVREIAATPEEEA